MLRPPGGLVAGALVIALWLAGSAIGESRMSEISEARAEVMREYRSIVEANELGQPILSSVFPDRTVYLHRSRRDNALWMAQIERVGAMIGPIGSVGMSVTQSSIVFVGERDADVEAVELVFPGGRVVGAELAARAWLGVAPRDFGSNIQIRMRTKERENVTPVPEEFRHVVPRRGARHGATRQDS